MNKQLKDIVERILENEPDTRNSDELLMLKVWAEQRPELRSIGYTFGEFAHLFLNTKALSKMESITRCRRKVQEQRPELRGTKYIHRQEKEIEVRQEIIPNL